MTASKPVHFAGIALLLLTACHDDPVVPPVTPPDTVKTPPGTNIFQAAISEPVGARAGNVVNARNFVGNVINGSGFIGNVYTAFSVGELPNVRNVRISNITAGDPVSSAYAVVNGALDPVAISANVGDTLELQMTKRDGTIALLRAAVPIKRPPRVIRTDPPNGRTDVTLNTKILVVFSEPIDGNTITSASLQLLAGGQAVAGRFILAASPTLSVEFAPAQPLSPGTSYTLVSSQNIRDLSGDFLQPADTARFRTGPPVSSGSVRQIAFVSCYEENFDGCVRTGISVINDDGSGERALTEGPNASGPSWSPDGKKIVFSSTFRVYVINADGSAALQLTSDTLSGLSPSWSPDGKRIAFLCDANRLCIMNADGSGTRLLIEDDAAASLTWSPDGSRIAYISYKIGNAGLHVIDVDGSRRLRLTTGSVLGVGTWSPDGRRIAYNSVGNDGTHVHVIDADGANDVKLPPRTDFGGSPQWSPDGRTIAFEVSDHVRSRIRVAVMNADGRNVIQLADGFAPAWSPDGSKIAYIGGGVSTGFVVAAVDGSRSTAVYTTYSVVQVPVAWSPKPPQ